MKTPRLQVIDELMQAMKAIAPEYGDVDHRRVVRELDAIADPVPEMTSQKQLGDILMVRAQIRLHTRRNAEGGAA